MADFDLVQPTNQTNVNRTGVDDELSIRGVDRAVGQLEKTIAGSDPLTNMLINREAQESGAASAARTAANRQQAAQSNLSDVAQATGARQTARDVATAQASGFADLGTQLTARRDQAVQGLANIGFQEEGVKMQKESMQTQEEQFDRQQTLAEERFGFDKELTEENFAQDDYNNLINTMDLTTSTPEDEASLEAAWNRAYPNIDYPGVEKLRQEQIREQETRTHTENVETLGVYLANVDWTNANSVVEAQRLYKEAYPDAETPTFKQLQKEAATQALATHENSVITQLFQDTALDGKLYTFNNDSNSFDFNDEVWLGLDSGKKDDIEEWYRLSTGGDGGRFMTHGGSLTQDGRAWLENSARAFGYSEFQKSLDTAVSEAANIYPDDIQAQENFIDSARLTADAFKTIGTPNWQETSTGDNIAFGDNGDAVLMPDYITNAGQDEELGLWTLTGDNEVIYDAEGEPHVIGEDGYEKSTKLVRRIGGRSKRVDIVVDAEGNEVEGVIVEPGTIRTDDAQYKMDGDTIQVNRNGSWEAFDGSDQEVDKIKGWFNPNYEASTDKGDDTPTFGESKGAGDSFVSEGAVNIMSELGNPRVLTASNVTTEDFSKLLSDPLSTMEPGATGSDTVTINGESYNKADVATLTENVAKFAKTLNAKDELTTSNKNLLLETLGSLGNEGFALAAQLHSDGLLANIDTGFKNIESLGSMNYKSSDDMNRIINRQVSNGSYILGENGTMLQIFGDPIRNDTKNDHQVLINAKDENGKVYTKWISIPRGEGKRKSATGWR